MKTIKKGKFVLFFWQDTP